MFRFLLKPKWVVLTVLVALLVVVMVNLGFWQLRRLNGREAANAEIRARQAAPTVPVDSVVLPDTPLGQAAAAVEWRQLTAIGTYDVAHQVLIRNRSYQGAPGYHVVTPLVTAAGPAVLVNRGFIPLGTNATVAPAVPAPPSGQVTVVGRARATQTRGALGPRDPATGVLTELARVDIARLRQQLSYPVEPVYLELSAQQPAATEPLPKLIEPPSLDDGPHLSYAVQWFIFSTCAVIGWVVVVRRQVRDDAKRRHAHPGPEEQAPASPAPV